MCIRILRDVSKLTLQPLDPNDIPALADLWFRGWKLGHLDRVPAELAAVRTLDSFEKRIRESIPDCYVSKDSDSLTGFVRIKGAEIDQFYLEPTLVGSDLGRPLMQAAEALMLSKGITRPHLICAADNDRAAGFYAALGWENMGLQNADLEATGAPFTLQVIRFEKSLG